jgi:hypothetical protein
MEQGCVLICKTRMQGVFLDAARSSARFENLDEGMIHQYLLGGRYVDRRSILYQ